MSASTTLSLALVSELAGGQDIRTVTEVNCSGKGFKKLDDLSPCLELTKLNLAKNALGTIAPLVDVTSLTWLNCGENKLRNLNGVQKLERTVVINASRNNLNSIAHVSGLKCLQVLVVNDNGLKSIKDCRTLPRLATLVASRNEIEDLSPLSKTASLKKVSASHNAVRSIPDFSLAFGLKELRLNNNKIMTIPPTLAKNPNLCLLDLGNNSISKLSDLDVLAELTFLQNLNLKGNPVVDLPGYQDKITSRIPSLHVLDGKRLLARKGRKRKAGGDVGSEGAPTPAAASGSSSSPGPRKEPEKKRARANDRGEQAGPSPGAPPKGRAASNAVGPAKRARTSGGFRKGGQPQSPAAAPADSAAAPRRAEGSRTPAKPATPAPAPARPEATTSSSAGARKRGGFKAAPQDSPAGAVSNEGKTRERKRARKGDAKAAADPAAVSSSATPGKAPANSSSTPTATAGDTKPTAKVPTARSGVVAITVPRSKKQGSKGTKKGTSFDASLLGSKAAALGEGLGGGWD